MYHCCKAACIQQALKHVCCWDEMRAVLLPADFSAPLPLQNEALERRERFIPTLPSLQPLRDAVRCYGWMLGHPALGPNPTVPDIKLHRRCFAGMRLLVYSVGTGELVEYTDEELRLADNALYDGLV